mgnify:CR=1 FL=1
MTKINLLPHFPPIGEQPPTLEDIESQNPTLAMIFWGGLSMALLFFLPEIGRIPIKMSTPWAILIDLIFSILGTVVLLIFYSTCGQYTVFKAIDEKSSPCSWSCSDLVEFFQDNPEFSPYYEAVLQQGRHMYVAEICALLEKKRAAQKSNACTFFFKSHE